MTKVTIAQGNKSVAATGNRFRALKLKYDLNLRSKCGSGAIPAASTGQAAAASTTSAPAAPGAGSANKGNKALANAQNNSQNAAKSNNEGGNPQNLAPGTKASETSVKAAKKGSQGRPRNQKGAKANQGPISAVPKGQATPAPATPLVPSSSVEPSSVAGSMTQATPTPNPTANTKGKKGAEETKAKGTGGKRGRRPNVKAEEKKPNLMIEIPPHTASANRNRDLDHAARPDLPGPPRVSPNTSWEQWQKEVQDDVQRVIDESRARAQAKAAADGMYDTTTEEEGGSDDGDYDSDTPLAVIRAMRNVKKEKKIKKEKK